MGFVDSFGHSMIETFLDDDGLHYLRDRDGDFIVQFGYDDEIHGHPRFLLAVSGEDAEQFCLRGDTMRRIPRQDFDRFTKLCNEWNAHYKMPKVYFEVEDPNTSVTGRIVCEQWLDLEVGIHQELVNHLASTFFSACFGFWRWIERQEALQSLIDGPGERLLEDLIADEDPTDEEPAVEEATEDEPDDDDLPAD